MNNIELKFRNKFHLYYHQNNIILRTVFNNKSCKVKPIKCF